MRWYLAAPADAPALREFVRAAYSHYVQRIGREPAPMQADYDAIARSGRALLLHYDERLVAVLVTKVEARALLVENLAVLPAMQGAGLGALLLQQAERIAGVAGRSELRLYTNEAMVKNVAYYRRHGFTETHRSVEDGYRRIHFRKVLPLDRSEEHGDAPASAVSPTSDARDGVVLSALDASL